MIEKEKELFNDYYTKTVIIQASSMNKEFRDEYLKPWTDLPLTERDYEDRFITLLYDLCKKDNVIHSVMNMIRDKYRGEPFHGERYFLNAHQNEIFFEIMKYTSDRNEVIYKQYLDLRLKSTTPILIKKEDYYHDK